MATKIEPTVGRVVWFWPTVVEDVKFQQPLAATIAAVLNNGTKEDSHAVQNA